MSTNRIAGDKNISIGYQGPFKAREDRSNFLTFLTDRENQVGKWQIPHSFQLFLFRVRILVSTMDQHWSVLSCPNFSTRETRNCLVDPDTPDRLALLNRFKRPRKRSRILRALSHSLLTFLRIARRSFPVIKRERDRRRLPKKHERTEHETQERENCTSSTDRDRERDRENGTAVSRLHRWCVSDGRTQTEPPEPTVGHPLSRSLDSSAVFFQLHGQARLSLSLFLLFPSPFSPL